MIPNRNLGRARGIIVAAAAARSRSALPFPVARNPFAAFTMALDPHKTGPVSNDGRPVMVALIGGIAYVRITIRVRVSLAELLSKLFDLFTKLGDFVLQGRLVANFVIPIAALAALAALRSITLVRAVAGGTTVGAVMLVTVAMMFVMGPMVLVTMAMMLVTVAVMTIAAAILVIDRPVKPLVTPIVAAPLRPIM
jgi:hypothetical protein